MSRYNYLIVGGGMTADAAVGGIRKVDPQGPIGLIGEETHLPYNRPPLSKGLWKGRPIESIWRRNANHEAIVHLGRRAVSLDLAAKTVTDDRGTVHGFQKLLLATGARPRQLDSTGEVLYFRTLDDYHRLRMIAEQRQRFAVIGGGFIGSEIAAALRMIGKDVLMLFPEEAIGAQVFPPDVAQFLNQRYRAEGVEVLPGESVVSTGTRDDRCTVSVQNVVTGRRRTLVVDAAVAGVGIEPNVELAQSAGLTVDDGIRVDATLRTSHPDVFAAGDVASFFNSALEKYLRVEHEDNANTMGDQAGRSMAGETVHYDYLPSFYADLFDLGYEAVGELDPSMETVADWKEPHRRGVVYYLRDGRVRGVLLWNVDQAIDAARELIAMPVPVRAHELVGRI